MHEVITYTVIILQSWTLPNASVAVLHCFLGMRCTVTWTFLLPVVFCAGVHVNLGFSKGHKQILVMADTHLPSTSIVLHTHTSHYFPISCYIFSTSGASRRVHEYHLSWRVKKNKNYAFPCSLIYCGFYRTAGSEQWLILVWSVSRELSSVGASRSLFHTQ